MEDRDLAPSDVLPEEEPLTLPNFDDEATVQSARPVVPLHEVRKAVRSRNKMLLGSALCLAALVGAVAASLVFSQRSQPVEESATAAMPESSKETNPGFSTPSGEASGAIVDPRETVAVETEAASADSTEGRPEVQTAPVNRKQPVRNTRVPKPVEEVVSNPEPDPDQYREAVERAARREERREARRLRRERRTADGLTRIREIFEGSPRP
jgi:hypothetical protein